MVTQQDYQSVKRIQKNYEIIYIYLTNKSKSHVVLRNNKNGTKISFYKFKFEIKFEITFSYYNFNSGKKQKLEGMPTIYTTIFQQMDYGNLFKVIQSASIVVFH